MWDSAGSCGAIPLSFLQEPRCGHQQSPGLGTLWFVNERCSFISSGKFKFKGLLPGTCGVNTDLGSRGMLGARAAARLEAQPPRRLLCVRRDL